MYIIGGSIPAQEHEALDTYPLDYMIRGLLYNPDGELDTAWLVTIPAFKRPYGCFSPSMS